ncbi:MAG: glutamate 5-kinase [Firmicutes bacterium]|nr:glutamate 5-kinase [Clostridiales bacterium]MBQ4339711.1 glutamate 5-kinase [Bacillota bacterium]
MRVVVKVGTSTLAHSTGLLNIRHVENLCKVLSDIKNSGIELALVSSGAIGVGQGKLSLKERPSDLPTTQAAAAVGQCELMYTYDKMFGEYNHTVGQVLVTASDIEEETRRDNFINTMVRLMQLGALPIINENDTVATDEIVIGDNDTLGAVVAKAIGAELLIILSDVEGLYDKNPNRNPDAKLLHLVEEITQEHYDAAEGSVSKLGTGGMVTKLKAAEIAGANGCETIIANGNDPSILYDILEGKQVGTRFLAKKRNN